MNTELIIPLLAAAIQSGTPILYATLGEILTEKSGVLNLGVEGMMISPGYSYDRAPDQDHFLKREQTVGLFRRLLSGAAGRWRFHRRSPRPVPAKWRRTELPPART